MLLIGGCFVIGIGTSDKLSNNLNAPVQIRTGQQIHTDQSVSVIGDRSTACESRLDLERAVLAARNRDMVTY